MTDTPRLDAEWVLVNAILGVMKISTKGDTSKATYANALKLAGELLPDILGSDESLLKRRFESNTAKKYRQRASVDSFVTPTSPVSLIQSDINIALKRLQMAKKKELQKAEYDMLKRELETLEDAEKELNPKRHEEGELIFRDAFGVERTVPVLKTGLNYRDFELPNSNILRIRVLHPGKLEHITGADIVYEKYSRFEETVRIVAVQYKIWEDKILYLSDERMQKQLTRIKNFLCDKTMCTQLIGENSYRFPCCAGFLRPTDRLQNEDQRFISSGEHLPICRIDECKSEGSHGADVLEYTKMRDVSLSSETFERLFNTAKIGSRPLTCEELENLYKRRPASADEDTVTIHAQEFVGDLEFVSGYVQGAKGIDRRGGTD